MALIKMNPKRPTSKHIIKMQTFKDKEVGLAGVGERVGEKMQTTVIV